MQIYAANSTRTDLLLLIGAIYYQLGNYEQVTITVTIMHRFIECIGLSVVLTNPRSNGLTTISWRSLLFDGCGARKLIF